LRLPSNDARALLDKRSQQYEANGSKAATYLASRGIPTEAVETFRLGVVDEHPLDYMVGRLSIPYSTFSGILGIKYRCMRDHDCKTESCPKYLYDDGEEPRLYNASATLNPSPLVFITEGELDAIAVQSLTGYPACAVPGADMWARNRYWARCFSAFPLVVIPADGDKAGKALAKIVAADLPQLRIAHMPLNEDANSVLAARGVEGFMKLCDLEDYISEASD
jgi:DNA primase